MATKVFIDEELLEEARRVGKHATATDAVNEALAEYIQHRKQAEITALFHAIDYYPTYDYKSQRRKR